MRALTSLSAEDLVLEDTTLRDGEQAPGVAFDQATKTRILDGLIAAGVTSVEVGIPAMGGAELDFLKSVVGRQDEARLIPWNRGVREDVAASLDLGFRAVHIGLPASDAHLTSSVGKSREWLLRTARDLVGYAKDRGAFVSVSAEDLARTDPDFLIEYAHTVDDAGADRLRLSDTVGMLGPDGYGERVGAIARNCGIDLQCHAHNDFGLGTANTLAGIAAGARYFHVTINGVGERAGMADIAQMVATMKYLYGVDLGIDIAKLVDLSAVVADATHHRPCPWQPIVGENVFAHESGIHVNAMLKDSRTFEPFPPHEIGRQSRYVLGKHSGRALVRQLLSEHGLAGGDPVEAACLRRVREIASRQGGAVGIDQFLALHAEITNGSAPDTAAQGQA